MEVGTRPPSNESPARPASCRLLGSHWLRTPFPSAAVACRRTRKAAVVAVVPGWVVEEILDAPEHTSIDRPAWMSENQSGWET